MNGGMVQSRAFPAHNLPIDRFPAPLCAAQATRDVACTHARVGLAGGGSPSEAHQRIIGTTGPM
eukprot:360575-Chlamydomonas_euryale.AAC.3